MKSNQFVVVLLTFILVVAAGAQNQKVSPLIAFTEVPYTLGHTSNTCQRVLTADGPVEFATQDLHTGGTQNFGTQFSGWLRDGRAAIVLRVTCPPSLVQG
jgi:hypothetical protein